MPTLELIFGPMFSGKSSELYSRAKRMYSVIEHKGSVLVVNSNIDTRCAKDKMRTHDGMEINAVKVDTLSELTQMAEFNDVKVILIDEAQFFSDLVPFVKEYISQKSFIVAGLNGDAKQSRFGDLLDLIPLADKVFHKTALCMNCRDGTTSAPFTILKKNVRYDSQVTVGAGDTYIPVCRACMNKMQ